MYNVYITSSNILSNLFLDSSTVLMPLCYKLDISKKIKLHFYHF